MDAKETYRTKNMREPLLYNAAYYKYIFKKTEKIVCALFYVLRNSNKSQNSIVAESLRGAAKKTLDEVVATLPYSLQDSQERIRSMVTSYVALESDVRLAQADLLIDSTVADTLCLEIDLVLKGLRSHLITDNYNPLDLSIDDVVGKALVDESSNEFSRTRPLPPSITRGSSAPLQSKTTEGQTTSRRQTIKDILGTHPHATIKDISAKVQDCSEKTLQRELISMIKDGIVHKEGERRWSRYSLA